jgi:hypothetical protein
MGLRMGDGIDLARMIQLQQRRRAWWLRDVKSGDARGEGVALEIFPFSSRSRRGPLWSLGDRNGHCTKHGLRVTFPFRPSGSIKFSAAYIRSLHLSLGATTALRKLVSVYSYLSVKSFVSYQYGVVIVHQWTSFPDFRLQAS